MACACEEIAGCARDAGAGIEIGPGGASGPWRGHHGLRRDRCVTATIRGAGSTEAGCFRVQVLFWDRFCIIAAQL